VTAGRTGGALLVAGSVGFAFLVLYALTGGSISTGSTNVDISKVLEVASMVLLGIGAAIVALVGPPLRAALPARVGLALVGLGLLGLGVSEAVFAVSPGGDPLASPLIVVEFVGLLVVIVGELFVGIALIREPGVGALGILLLGGLIALLASVFVPGDMLMLRNLVALGGGASMIAGWLGLGLLCLRSVEAQAT
jgi:hypothetical protein